MLNPYARILLALIAVVLAVLPVAAPLAYSTRTIQPVAPLEPDQATLASLPPHVRLAGEQPLGAPAATASSEAPVKVVVAGNEPGSSVKEFTVDSRGEVYHVTLITGDEVVAVKTPNGTWAVYVKPITARRSFTVIPAGDTLYVIPNGVDLRKFSIDLFNVRLLAEYKRLGLDYIPIIVKLRSIPNEPLYVTFNRLLPEAAKLPHLVLHIINGVALHVPVKRAATVYRELASSPVVLAVTLDRIYRAAGHGAAAPKLFRSVPYIGVPSMWQLGVNGSGVRIAVLDTGIDTSHPDLYIGNQSKVIASRSFVDYDFDGQPDEPPSDGFGHGTHCAGIAAGTGNYMPQITGVAPGALLLNGKVLSNAGWGYDSWIIEGIEWAVNNSADIISMSLGGLAVHGYDPLADAVNKAFEKGVVVVVAAGNEGPDLFTVASPGVAPGALTVGAYDVDRGIIAGFSSRGPTVNLTVKPDVVAPGVDILSARANNTWMGEPGTLYHVYASGTSMATPHVSGLAALVLEFLNKTGILAEATSALGVPASHIVKDVIVSTATGYDEASPLVYGMGLVNATNIVYLYNSSLLLIPEPAHTDILVGENKVYNVTIRLFNPFNETRVVKVEVLLQLFPGAEEAGASGAVTAPATVEVPAGGAANVTIAIDASKLPVGVHAVKLFFVDNQTGVVAAKAMIGVGKPALVRVNAYYKGRPVQFCANIIGLDLSSGASIGSTNVYGLVYGWPSCGNGTVVVGPLLPNKAYLLYAEMEPQYNGSLTIAGSYYAPIIVSSGEKNILIGNITVDFAELLSVKIYVPPGDYYAAVLAYHEAAMNVTVGAASYTVSTFSLPYSTGYGAVELEYHVGFGGSVSAGAALASVGTVVFAASSQLIPNVAPLSRVYVFYREYNSIPFGEEVNAKPTVATDTMLHVHSAVGSVMEEYGGLATFCGSQMASIAPFLPVTTGSITAYMIDSNATCSAIAEDYIPTDTLDIDAVSWWEYSYNGYRAYAPLAFPVRMTTLWSYMFAYRGLDGYNFSGAYAAGNIFRTWLTGFYMLSSQYPLTTMVIAPNFKQPKTFYYPWSLTGVELYWIPDNTTPPGLDAMLVLNTMLLNSSGLGFATREATFHASTVLNGSYVPGITLYEFGYGVGGRDIVPLAGYDILSNMVPPGENLALLILFNEPVWSDVHLNTSSVQVVLANENATINGVVVRWGRLGGVPLPYAVVVFPTANAPTGVYRLMVSAEYYDNTTGSRTSVYYVVDPAVYVGKPMGPLTYPAEFNVTITATLKNLLGQPITQLLPGTTGVLTVNYTLIGFNGTAKLVIEVLKDGETMMKTCYSVKPESTGSIEAVVALPWAPGTYKIKVYLLLDNVIAVVKEIPA